MGTDRVTKSQAEQCAKRLAEALGKKFGSCWKKSPDGKGNVAEIGCYGYDHNSIYGGGVITEIVTEGGGEHHPFGDRRLKPDTFCQATRFAEKAIKISKEK